MKPGFKDSSNNITQKHRFKGYFVLTVDLNIILSCSYEKFQMRLLWNNVYCLPFFCSGNQLLYRSCLILHPPCIKNHAEL